MKKKGFTLVELLAVIAILAVLIIMVLPNIMNLFNQAKQNSFENELKEIFKASQQQWVKDSRVQSGNIVYSKTNVNCPKELKLSGRTNINYYVELDKSGKIIKLFATDDTYQYEYRGEELKIDEIVNSKQIANLQENDIISLTCAGERRKVEDCSGNTVASTIPSNATGLYKIMAEQAYLDNAKSEFVTRCEGIDFSKVSSDTNGKGVYEIASTKNDTYPIYYYRGAVTNNNVKFGGFCWKAVRTTNTGGIKLVYNGAPDGRGHCSNTAGDATQIGTSEFNDKAKSLQYAGYMYGTMDGTPTGNPYNGFRVISASNAGMLFGESVTYSNGTYTLTNTIPLTSSNYNREASFNNNHYTCFNESGTCKEVNYLYGIFRNPERYVYYYIPIKGVDPNGRELIDEVIDRMFSNDADSKAKIEIENWYENHMTSFTSKIEDTVYCNDRSISVKGSWTSTGNVQANTGTVDDDLKYNGEKRIWRTYQPSLVCKRANDKFTVSSSIGNGKLKFPVGLLTADEMNLAGSNAGGYAESCYLRTKKDFWTMTPVLEGNIIYVSDAGGLGGIYIGDDNFGLRPVISISKNTRVTSGDGNANDPYVIG